MSTDSIQVHLLAGGAGGTAGAVLTCPLEVVKTRQQSSVATFSEPNLNGKNSTAQGLHNCSKGYVPQQHNYSTSCTQGTTRITVSQARMTPGLWGCLKHIVQNEGVGGLFRGLGPNLVGVAPSRAIYFCAYAQSKSLFNTILSPETPQVHMCSAAIAGFAASTATNPIWYIKTRLQLDAKANERLTVTKCIKDTYKERGVPGFYRGITASYYGIAETVIHFVIYESIKAKIRERKKMKGIDKDHHVTMDFLEYMGAGAVSKTTATVLAYPHEVARTRLRQEGSVYKHFWQTLGLVFKEEGVHGLYRGLATQLVRQIPNTAVMMATYEAVVYVCSTHVVDDGEQSHDY